MGAGPELHGYTEWGSKTPELPSRVLNKNGIFPTVFQLLRDARPEAEIGCLYEWEGIKYLVDTLSLNYHYHVADCNKTPKELGNMASAYIKEKHPALVAICYDGPDHTGHTEGHDTPAYYEKLKELDIYVGQIVQAVKDAGILDDTIFILTSDHGGIDKGHGGKTMQEMETAFIISGKNIKKGLRFDDVSMMQYDVASTIASIIEPGHIDVKQDKVRFDKRKLVEGDKTISGIGHFITLFLQEAFQKHGILQVIVSKKNFQWFHELLFIFSISICADYCGMVISTVVPLPI